MSLPTKIRFLDGNKTTIATEHYNAGWWVPDTVGNDIATLYSDELWTYVIAYSHVYNRNGYPVGELSETYDDTSDIIWFDVDKQNELKRIIDTPPPPITYTECDTSECKIPMVVKPLPTLLVEDLVGIQPMVAPAGQVFSMRYIKTSEEPEKLYFTIT